MKADGTVGPIPRNGASNNGAGVPIDPLTGDVNGTAGQERPPPRSDKSGGALAGSLLVEALEALQAGTFAVDGRGWLPPRAGWVGREPVVHKESSHCLALATRARPAGRPQGGASRLDVHLPVGGSPARCTQHAQGARKGAPWLQGTSGSAGHGSLRACCWSPSRTQA